MHWIYAHLIGDFILQNHWMAVNKKTSWLACSAHVGTYLIPFLFCGLEWWQIALIGVEHFIQDKANVVPWFMRIKGSAGFMDPPLGPWSIIVTDNILHILFMAFVASL